MNRKMKVSLALAAAACLLTQTNVWAEEEDKPTAGVDLGVFSQYISRGMELSKDSLIIQPSMTIGYKGVSLNLWGNLDTNSDVYDEAKYNETDLTVSYSKTFGVVKLTGGYIYYGLDGALDSQEIVGTVAVTTLLNPTLTVYREIAHLPSWYAVLGISHSFEVHDKITLDLGASASYIYSDDSDMAEANNPDEKYRQLHNGVASVGFTIPFGEYFSVKPTLAYSFPLTDKAKDYIQAASLSDESSFLYGGVTLSMAF
jgi:hypothetical protein